MLTSYYFFICLDGGLLKKVYNLELKVVAYVYFQFNKKWFSTNNMNTIV